MEVSRESQLELAVCSPASTFQDLMDSQQELFRSQIDQLQNIVVTQCKLTGVNPLSQEMAAGALSIKIGKRPRDLLNPKAVKYMQSVFSIKDAISKKESREISALFGVTITQVRDFFNSQRTRVRKFVRLSREKALRSNMCKEEAQNGVPVTCDSGMPINLVPLNSIGPTNIEEGPSCPTQDETLPGIDDSDKSFLDNIFPMMRNEETFSGQVKLMEWILQIHNSSVLNRFLTKGGVMILATWLSQAATEEQTSVLRVILKVLCHLPLHKALPVHMSAILQSVNRLRFYKTSDISNRARILLSRWSKIFARSQAVKKPNANKSLVDAQDEMLLKRSISEIMGNELWDTKCDIPDANPAPSYDDSENFRKLEAPQPLKLLPASTDDSNKKLIRGISSSQTRERRKVLMVEQPGQKLAGRSTHASRSAPATQGRPLSADDIQKAKMRAQFMQTKYGRNGTSSNEGHQMKIEGPNRSSETGILFSASKTDAQPQIEEPRKPVIISSEVFNQPEASLDSKMTMDPEEPIRKKCKRVQIPWLTPPEIRINAEWNVGTGENSKEVEVQKNRIRREKEIAYKTAQEIPFDPKEPWDREMDYDDTLTPEIPIEQLPDAEEAEATLVSPCENKNTSINLATTSSQNLNESIPEPDLELLAVLLKNPELVFALTSDQGSNLSSEETVKLLDMIKANGIGAPANLSGLDRKAEKVEVSLPSPTPSGDPVTSGWRPEVARNPFSRQSLASKPEAYATAGIAETIPAQEMHPASSRMLPHVQSVDMMVPHHRQASQAPSQQTVPHYLPQTVASIPEQLTPSLLPSLHQSALSRTDIPALVSEMVLNQKHVSHVPHIPLPNSPSPNLPAALRQADAVGGVKAAPLNTPDGLPLAFSVPPMLPAPAWPEQHLQPPTMPEPRPLTQSWRVGRGLTTNLHSQAIRDNYNGTLQPQVLPGRDEFTGQPGFETWSPENSPIRSPERMSGWNFLDTGLSIGDSYRLDRSRIRTSSGYRDQSRYGNRRWRERERDRDRDRDRRR